MGVIAVETRAVEVVIPADPGNPESDTKVKDVNFVISFSRHHALPFSFGSMKQGFGVFELFFVINVKNSTSAMHNLPCASRKLGICPFFKKKAFESAKLNISTTYVRTMKRLIVKER